MEPVRKSYEVISPDKEIAAIAIILQVLNELDESEQQRALTYLQSRTCLVKGIAGQADVGSLRMKL